MHVRYGTMDDFVIVLPPAPNIWQEAYVREWYSKSTGPEIIGGELN